MALEKSAENRTVTPHDACDNKESREKAADANRQVPLALRGTLLIALLLSLVFSPSFLPVAKAALQRTTIAVRPEESEEEEPWAPVSAVLVRWSPPAVLVRWRYRYPAAEKEDALHFRVFYQEVHDKLSGRVAVASGGQRSVLLERLQPEAEYVVRVFARASPSLATRANRTTDAPVGLVRFVAPGTAATATAAAANGSSSGNNNSSSSSGGSRGGLVSARSVVVRDEEIVIVVLVLSVWLAVILLFFNNGAAALHRLHRLRHNSVFVGSQILVPLSRRTKSAEDIKSMVLQIEHQPSTQSTAL
ncbi:hypothetical protein HPB51_010753 [Rhipicephalus microplus]|uniref:Fibronectin type-III domain-containing protein n=1 Tax=Rhipicephalus microplus TaxID=6941 RepID=A0A9J6DTX9_RHIMP|nr:hypothetical protein HPB51_010753 [Rhipicephalus microplus]